MNCGCSGYQEKCHGLHPGKITSMYMPKVEGYENQRPPAFAILLGVLALATIINAPAVGGRAPVDRGRDSRRKAP